MVTDRPECKRAHLEFVLCGCEAQAVLRCRHLIVNPGNQMALLTSKQQALCSECGAAQCLSEGCTEDGERKRCTVHCSARPDVLCSVLVVTSEMCVYIFWRLDIPLCVI